MAAAGNTQENTGEFEHVVRSLKGCGLTVPGILLPGSHIDYAKWAVIACDQFTSQPEYWQEAKSIVAGSPSTLNLIVPEAFLNDNFEERLADIRRSASEYSSGNVFKQPVNGFVLTERSMSDGSTRHGLVVALDLEAYEYKSGSRALVRATEATVAERLPPRFKIKRASPIDLSHVLLLVDDAEQTLIEPIVELSRRNELETLYDFDLMLGGGHIKVTGLTERHCVSSRAT